MRDAHDELQSRLGKNRKDLAISASFNLLIDFYNDSRATDALPVGEDGDMLLFEWGVSEGENGSHFEIGLTRQFILPDGEDENIWQVQLSYLYNVEEKFRLLGSGEKWCSNPAEAAVFRDYVLQSLPVVECDQTIAKSITLTWEHV